MIRKNTVLGMFLLFLGVSMYFRNFRIGTGSLLTLFLGLGLLYAYYSRREQPFIIFGGIFTGIGLMSVMHDLRIFRIDMSFETMLIVLGIIFIFIYYSKQIQSFIFPGMILPALGIYLILSRTVSDRYASPSIFLLLGFAFYAIYFIAYMGKSNWPLIVATILLLLGIAGYALSFKVITWNSIYLKGEYIFPLILIGAGALILLNMRKRRS